MDSGLFGSTAAMLPEVEIPGGISTENVQNIPETGGIHCFFSLPYFAKYEESVNDFFHWNLAIGAGYEAKTVFEENCDS